MTTQYKRFVKLIAKWPIDATKGDRDLGKFIREKVKVAFDSGNLAQFDSKECAQQYAVLTRLANNTYRNKYKRLYQSTSTGLSTEECRAILSSDMLEYLKEEDKGFFRKIFTRD